MGSIVERSTMQKNSMDDLNATER